MSLSEIQRVTVFLLLIIVSYVGVFALFKCRSDKKGNFLLVAFSVIIHVFGYFLEVISKDAGEAFTAFRLISFGGGLCALVNIFFVADYCDQIISKAVKAILSAGTIIYVIGAWTTDVTGYFFSSFELNLEVSNHVTYTSGTLTWLFLIYNVIYFAIALIILVRKLALSFGDYKKTLILTLFAFLFPVIAAPFGYIPIAGRFFSMPLTPYACGISAILYFISIRKYDMLDKYPLATMQAMNTISQAIVLLDEKLHYISSNSAAIAMFPWLREYKTGEPIFYSPYWPPELSDKAFTEGEFSVDFSSREPDSPRHYNATAHPFQSDLSRKIHWSIMIQDITDTEHFIKQLEEAAYTDTLTGLYNRRHFAEIASPFIERARRAGMSYYIMMADLDFFKRINDEHGHLAGDAVLRHTAQIMKNTVRAYDVVARWGGEEFIFLITDSTTEDVTALAERIRYTIEHKVCEFNKEKLPITISFGVAECGKDETDMTELILRADEALYKSKQNGRNCVTLWRKYE